MPLEVGEQCTLKQNAGKMQISAHNPEAVADTGLQVTISVFTASVQWGIDAYVSNSWCQQLVL